MNRRDMVREVASVMRENGMRKTVSVPRQKFHISDDYGNKRDFVVRQTDKNVLYTIEDVDAVLEASIQVIMECLKRGEPITFKGFGSLGLRYRKERRTKSFDSKEQIVVAGHYIPKFNFGVDLRKCAKIYEVSLDEKLERAKIFKEDIDEEADGD